MAGFWERELMARQQREQRVAEQQRAAEQRRFEEQRRRQQEEARRRAEERSRAADAARLRAQAEAQRRAEVEAGNRALAEARAAEARRAAMARQQTVPATSVAPVVQEAEQRSFWDRFSLPTGTPMVRPVPLEEQPSVEEFAAQMRPAGQLVSDVLFGPEMESVRPGTQDAGLLERFIRTQAGEQEFRVAGQRAQEGRPAAAVGWTALGLAGLIPFAGDIVQGAAGASRAVRGAGGLARATGAAGDVARGAEATGDVAQAGLTPRANLFDYGEVARYSGEGEAEFVARTIEQRAANAKSEIALRNPASPAAQTGNEKTLEFFYRAIQDGPAARVDNSATPMIFRAASDSGEIVEGADLSGKFVVGDVSGDFIDSPFFGVNELRTMQTSSDPRAAIEKAKDSFLSSLAGNERNVLYRDASNSISAGTEVDSAEDAFRLAASRGLVYVNDASTGNPVRVPNEYFENSSYPANVGENVLGTLPDRVNELAREIPLRGGDPALQEIYRVQGFDKPANVISRADASNLERQGYMRVYRGVNTKEPFDIVSDFATGEYYGGKGSYGNGTYTTRDELRASSYARYGDGEYETVMEIYVHPQARIMGPNDYARLDRERSLYLMSAEAMEKSPESARIVNAYSRDAASGDFKLDPAYSDMGRLIAAMGYDGFIPSITYSTTKQPEIVILNRGVLSVVDSPVEIPR